MPQRQESQPVSILLSMDKSSQEAGESTSAASLYSILLSIKRTALEAGESASVYITHRDKSAPPPQAGESASIYVTQQG